jgi:hypothetical protein
MKSGNNAPAWLFSFVDLAFLMLIAMTQMTGDAMPELGEIVVPRIHAEASSDLPPGATDKWQLRIYPPDDIASPVFELAKGSPEARALPERIDAATLRARLAALQEEGRGRPLLAPHEDSLSRHMLDAVGMLEEFWPNRRRVTIEPLLASK